MYHEDFMRQALTLAKQAAALGEVPVGCVVVHNGTVIGRGYNTRETKQSAIAHAEINAIMQACQTLGTWRLDDCTIYVTLEPCPMCAGAIFNAKIPRLIYGARDPKAGAISGLLHLFEYPLPHKLAVTPEVLGEECLAVLRDFFESLR
ncbi:MAG: tRNA adenosine(34) deaminase TadA [Oscillospiraceae bacterium]|nr:tRNA adenosine(34) deaminase TadA [Oscillospiraceae bacterium]